MPVQTDYSFYAMEDGVISITMTPATNIGGWGLEWMLLKYRDSTSGLVVKTGASGYAGSGNLSGLVVTNSGNGTFNVLLNSQDISGRDPRVYFHRTRRTDSGYRAVVQEGGFLLR